MALHFSPRQKMSEDPASSGNRNHGNQSQTGDPQTSSIPPPLPPLRPSNGTSDRDATAIRKYLVLLQDCLAIKFTPIVIARPHHHPPFAFNNGTSSQSHNSHRRNKNASNTTGVPPPGDEEDDHDHPLPSHQSSRITMSNGGSGGGKNAKCGSNSMSSEHHDHLNNSRQPHQNLHNCTRPNGMMNNNHEDNNDDPRQSFHLQNRPLSANLNGASYLGALSSNTAEVDHSLHALYLYKGFKEANAQCTWNSALTATFQNIQYKGYIVPSTILVGSTLPKFLSILRTAWSRQMLKCPAGYRIEFIGEIEEVIADPIQKGQFAPLSDSLCWAILELTSLGQEAFVDSIMSALQLAFPTMSCPSRELVFQTLEKLIKERKVYQTSRGYFVVTPEIFRYMVNANFHEGEGMNMKNKGEGMTLDALLHPNFQEQDKLSFSHHSWDSAVSTGENHQHHHHHHHNRCSSTSTGEDLIEVAPACSPKLKRHNSLKLIRQRDVAVTQMSGAATRRYSLRLPKSKSCGRMNDTIIDDEEVGKRGRKPKSSTIEHISRAMRSLRPGSGTIQNSSADPNGSGDCEKGKKNKSLLSKLFPFRRRSTSKSRNEKVLSPSSSSSSPQREQDVERAVANSNSTSTSGSSSSSLREGSMSPPTKTKHSENSSKSKSNANPKLMLISTQTQTSNSTEQLCIPAISVSGSEGKIPGRMSTGTVDSRPEAPEPEISAVDLNLLRHHNHQESFMTGEDSHQTRSSSRRSMSILDESPLYDVLQDVPSLSSPPSNGVGVHHHHHHHHHDPLGHAHLSPNFQVGCPVGPPTFPGYHHHHHPRESSRCSTLSSQAASSLGYGSQGHPSFNYSPNHLDSGLASSSSCGGSGGGGYYGGGEGSSYGYNGSSQQQHHHPPPAKPTQYSSTRYRNSYEWWKKRYPNYISPVGRSSPLYASLTAPRSKSRSRPTYESLLTTATAGPTPQETHNSNKNDSRDEHVTTTVDSDNPNVTTTTVTQAVKSTTNMEMQLLLPLGKIMKAALQAKKDAIRDAWLKDELGPGYAAYANKHYDATHTPTDSDQPIKINLDNSSGAKLRVGEPSTKTEVTTVVNNNGVIETHFDTNSDPIPQSMMKGPNSTLEIKTLGGLTDIVLVNGKTGEETKINGSHNIPKSKRASTSSTCAKMSEISKNCENSNKEQIKAY